MLMSEGDCHLCALDKNHFKGHKMSLMINTFRDAIDKHLKSNVMSDAEAVWWSCVSELRYDLR